MPIVLDPLTPYQIYATTFEDHLEILDREGKKDTI
jgi:hypothetical protein